MKRKRFRKLKKGRGRKKRKGPPFFAFDQKTKRQIWGVIMFLIAIIISFSFFDKAGVGGKIFMQSFTFLLGKTVFFFPLLFSLGAIAFLFFQEGFIKKEKERWQVFLAILFLILGIAGILGSWKPEMKHGGKIGLLISLPLLKIFGFWVTEIIFLAVIFIGGIILSQFLYFPKKKVKTFLPAEQKPSLIKKIFAPKFKVKEIPTEKSVISPLSTKKQKEVGLPDFQFKTEALDLEKKIPAFQPPPLDLLETEQQIPNSGDIRANSTIIKKTLQNFNIPVEMSEINIGPTVTQYTLKPAEGIKLSKITSLSKDLALALAAQSIRIEAPIPGKSLIGIEVPNKTRALVRLRNLIGSPAFQNAPSPLTFVLGRDVSGFPVFADLHRMPHLLVAGATGTGKTICLNNLILSLLYRNGPETLRFILIDPKRVEFTVYGGLPHLLCPVILDAQKTVLALKWLISEMERRFAALSAEKARDISAFNKKVLKKGGDLMPYIVLIIDELADLMAARGREVEAGIVRIAQLARATGIHLVVATQRPSVEVITGLIKANITSRITFQVASQVDSRTILDMAGAEKLLGAGDMLFISAETVKPKRIQGSFVSQKEIKKVVNWIKSKYIKPEAKLEIEQDQLAESIEKEFQSEDKGLDFIAVPEDPLYEKAKQTVIAARKASASFLQRKLRIGYARAARLLDLLEERGIVGPADGAKPRKVYIEPEE